MSRSWILNLTFKYLLDIISPMVGWCAKSGHQNLCIGGFHEIFHGFQQGLVNVPFWGYWTSPYSSHLDHIPNGWVMWNMGTWLMTHVQVIRKNMCLAVFSLRKINRPVSKKACVHHCGWPFRRPQGGRSSMNGLVMGWTIIIMGLLVITCNNH